MVTALFVALWRGWLVPGSTVDRLTKRYDAELERQDAELTRLEVQWRERLAETLVREHDWRSAHNGQAEIARVATAQTAELLKSFTVLEHYIRSTPRAIAELRAVPPVEEGTTR